jgi:hypothetical protein
VKNLKFVEYYTGGQSYIFHEKFTQYFRFHRNFKVETTKIFIQVQLITLLGGADAI